MDNNPKQHTDLKHRMILRLIPIAAMLIRVIGWTLRIRILDPHRVSPRLQLKEKFIYAFWHNQQLLSAFYFRNLGIRVLISRSKDGDYASGAVEAFGFKAIRSSSSSGKINALRSLARELASGQHVAITPDGPRGPLYCAQPGAIFLAALSGKQVTPFGCATDRVWRLHRTWDKFEIPKPFSRAVIIMGEPLIIPRQLDEASAEEWTHTLETRMTELRQQALAALEKKP